MLPVVSSGRRKRLPHKHKHKLQHLKLHRLKLHRLLLYRLRLRPRRLWLRFPLKWMFLRRRAWVKRRALVSSR
jgi:hypothetical protein